MERMPVARAFQWNQLLRQGSLILIAILVARSNLLLADIGRYEKFLYLQYALTFFWITGLIQGLLSFYPGLEDTKQSALLTTAYWVLCLPAFLLALVLLGSQGFIFGLLVGNSQLDDSGLFLLLLAFGSPSLLLDYVFLLQKKVTWIIGTAVVNALLLLTGVFLVLMAGLGVRELMLIQVLVSVLRHFLLIRALFGKQRIAWRPDWELAQSWIRISFPLMFYTLLGGLVPALTGWIVNWHYDGNQEQFALFRYGSRELPLTVALTEALSASVIPVLSGSLVVGLHELKHQSTRIMHWVFPSTILLVLTSSYWFPAVFGADFEASIPVLTGFLLITVSRLLFSKPILVALQENRMLLFFAFVELLLLCLTGLLLINYAGLKGLAIGVAIVFLLEKGLQVGYLYARHQIVPSDYIALKWWVAYSTILVATYLVVG